ncbi:MAG: hypothetical protein LBJ31_01365 [Treponema sp.]|jgi:hypothetical protein|nr:hypothetical protein [Treponema sp.]
MFGKKKDADPEKFWKEYEEKTGERVLAKSLGQYMSGWAEYPYPLWGLLIATSGGFRFHHFPHEGWIVALSRITTGGEAPKEKTIFIPRECIVSAALKTEKRWWKKIFSPAAPVLVVRYRAPPAADEGSRESEQELYVETELKAQAVCSALEGLIAEH